jgi:hypothetical protein
MAAAGLIVGLAVLVSVRAWSPTPRAGSTVFLIGELSDTDAACAVAAITASPHGGAILFDRPADAPRQPAMLAALQADQVIPIGSFRDSPAELSDRLGRPVCEPLTWPAGMPPIAVWKMVFPDVRRLVVASAEPTCLSRAMQVAAIKKAPLVLCRDQAEAASALAEVLPAFPIETVHAVGSASAWQSLWPDQTTDAIPAASP